MKGNMIHREIILLYTFLKRATIVQNEIHVELHSSLYLYTIKFVEKLFGHKIKFGEKTLWPPTPLKVN